MNKKANKRIFGMTQTQLLVLIGMGSFLLCVIVLFGGYIFYEMNRPVPVVIPPTSAPTLFTQPSVVTQLPVRPDSTSTLLPKATSRPTFTTMPTTTAFPTITISVPTVLTTTTAAPTTIEATATITLTPVPIESLVTNLSACEKTIYENYWIVLKYPANMGCDKRDDYLKSTGSAGFIEIMYKQVARTAKEYCETQIKDPHGQNRYGKNPTMKLFQIDNRPACWISPSSDQSSKYQKASLLVAEYPQSIIKDTLLLISADKSHIGGLISSLRFAR